MCVVQAWEYAHLVGLLTVEFDEGGVVQNCNGELIMPVGRGSFREPAYAASDEACPGHPNIKRRSSECPQKLRDDTKREQRQRPEQQRDQKLRAVAAQLDRANFTQEVLLWRGMQDLSLDQDEFMRNGGTELAPMSTSKSQSVAFKYAASRSP